MDETLNSSTRTLEIAQRFLQFPIQHGAPPRRMRIVVGALDYEFDIELAETQVDWWAPLNLAAHLNQTVVLTLFGEPSAAMDALHLSDVIEGDELVHSESRRPQLRYSPARGWLNDPNGLVFYDGEYHLFYQHNPYGIAWGTGVAWGSIHWGHAVSPDLVHWTELPIALYPDRGGEVFSGSAVVDWNDAASLQQGDLPCMLAFYTLATPQGTPFVQCLASSNDRGRTWTKHDGNPILSSEGWLSRDPKVFWHEPTRRWVLVLYIDRAKRADDAHPDDLNSYGIFVSDDLRSWELASEFMIPGDQECPELFELTLESGDRRWVALGALGRYLVGQFDGRSFTAESGPHELNHGDVFFASQTFNNIPVSDGRRILMAWARSWPNDGPSPLYRDMPFSQSMGLPLELGLRETNQGPRLVVRPVRELERLRTISTRVVDEHFVVGRDMLEGLTGDLWEIDMEVELGESSAILLEVRGVSIRYEAAGSKLTCGDRTAALEQSNGRIRIRVFVDRTAIDIFGNDGQLYMPMGVDLTNGPSAVSLRAEGEGARIVALDLHRLTSAWG